MQTVLFTYWMEGLKIQRIINIKNTSQVKAGKEVIASLIH
jgi:hypothetical protein